MEQKAMLVSGPRAVKAFMDRKMSSALADFGLTAGAGYFILFIKKNEGISMKAISESMNIDKAMTTRVVTKLIDGGFVEDAGEGHEYSLRLTEKGNAVSKAVKSTLDDVWAYLFKDLTDEEKDVFKTICFKVEKALKEAQR